MSEGSATKLCQTIREILLDKKAVDPLVLDVGGVSSITDFFIIATGSNFPHLRALAEDVEVTVKHQGTPVYRRSGKSESGWVVLDYVDVVVHLLTPELREFYALEQLWGDAVILP